ncbi:MAG: hypothetical protein QM763_00135 [Agriterribacter sp.]
MRSLFTTVIIFAIQVLHAQDSSINAVVTFPDKYLNEADSKIDEIDRQLTRQTEKYLTSFSKQEERLRRKMAKVDSSFARRFFGNTQQRYNELSQKLDAANGKFDKLSSGDYFPGLDSLQGSLAFLKDAKQLISKSKNIREKIDGTLGKANQLQQKLKASADIQSYLKQRQQELLNIMSRYKGFSKAAGKYMGKYQQQVFYYSQQLREYKTLLNDPDKLARRLTDIANSLPSFQQFMKKYSMLAALFPRGDDYGSPQSLAGLQTRADVQQILQQRLAIIPTGNAANSNPAQYVQQQLQEAGKALSGVQEKLSKLSNGDAGSAGDIAMPEKFTPNEQKTKKFRERLQYSVSFQSQRQTNYYPASTDFSLTAGYKIDDKSVIAVGFSAKMGWGKGWKNMKITGEGVGFRVYGELKAPDLFKTNSRFMGSLWLTAGAELNYSKTIESLAVFKNYSNWTMSSLAGLTKKYSISSPLKKGKKMQGTISVLYDFLYNRHIPPTPAFVWRVGYNF